MFLTGITWKTEKEKNLLLFPEHPPACLPSAFVRLRTRVCDVCCA
jgi:hypothetical protein